MVQRPELAPLLFLAVLALGLAQATPAFLATANLVSIVGQVSTVAIVALALNQVILSGEIDVSVGSMLAACALVFATVGRATGSTTLSLFTALATGTLLGALNGAVVTVGRVPSIIATLGTLLALRGGVLLIGADGVVTVADSTRVLGLGSVFGVPMPILILTLALVLFAAIARESQWGRDIVAVGSNPRAAAAVGLQVGWVRFRCFIATGAACGLASAIFSGQLGQIQATAATGFELQCIAAVVLGGTSLKGGRGSTLAPFLGAVLVGVILNALTLNRVPGTFEQLVLGLLILAAISVDALRFRLARSAA